MQFIRFHVAIPTLSSWNTESSCLLSSESSTTMMMVQSRWLLGLYAQWVSYRINRREIPSIAWLLPLQLLLQVHWTTHLSTLEACKFKFVCKTSERKSRIISHAHTHNHFDLLDSKSDSQSVMQAFAWAPHVFCMYRTSRSISLSSMTASPCWF